MKRNKEKMKEETRMQTSRLYFIMLDQIRTEMKKCKVTDISTIDVAEAVRLVDNAVTLLKTIPLSEISKKDKIENYEELRIYATILYKNALKTNRKYASALARLLFMCQDGIYFLERRKREENAQKLQRRRGY